MWLDALLSIVDKILKPVIDFFTEIVKQNQEITVHRGDKIVLKARSNGLYVQANNDSPTGDLISRGSKVDSSEIFEIVDSENFFYSVKNIPVLYGDKIALRATSNSHFVGVNYDDNPHILTSSVGHVDLWETFTLIPHPNSKAKEKQVLRYGDRIVLLANRGEYVMSHKEKDGLLMAFGGKIDTWETFMVINPNDPK